MSNDDERCRRWSGEPGAKRRGFNVSPIWMQSKEAGSTKCLWIPMTERVASIPLDFFRRIEFEQKNHPAKVIPLDSWFRSIDGEYHNTATLLSYTMRIINIFPNKIIKIYSAVTSFVLVKRECRWIFELRHLWTVWIKKQPLVGLRNFMNWKRARIDWTETWQQYWCEKVLHPIGVLWSSSIVVRRRRKWFLRQFILHHLVL